MKMRLMEWLVEDGARVVAGEVVCVVETENATQEVAAFEAGVLRRLKREGEVIAWRQDVPFRIEREG